MKQFLLLLSLLTAMSAQGALSTERDLQFLLGFKVHDVQDIDDPLKGVELSFGKQYTLGSFLGKTSIDLSYASVKYDYLFHDLVVASQTFKEYAYGITQTFLYNVNIGNIFFRPFIDFGAGNSHAIAKYETIFGREDTRRKSLLYFKYGAGAQVLSKKGIGGQVRVGQQLNKDYRGNIASLSFVYSI